MFIIFPSANSLEERNDSSDSSFFSTFLLIFDCDTNAFGTNDDNDVSDDDDDVSSSLVLSFSFLSIFCFTFASSSFFICFSLP